MFNTFIKRVISVEALPSATRARFGEPSPWVDCCSSSWTLVVKNRDMVYSPTNKMATTYTSWSTSGAGVGTSINEAWEGTGVVKTVTREACQEVEVLFSPQIKLLEHLQGCITCSTYLSYPWYLQNAIMHVKKSMRARHSPKTLNLSSLLIIFNML